MSIADDNNQHLYDGFEKNDFNDKSWQKVDVPHNWDEYGGYRRLRHGNRHGYAWYRSSFYINQQLQGKRCFLFFEGVGSYATVWLNGKQVGYHAGGRTTFTLDVTDAIKFNSHNVLAVRADHPAFIKDLPWICGGCSDDRGFSEGSQPMGIFRPVHLIITNYIRIEPFGVHIWNDTTTSARSAKLFFETEVKNYSVRSTNFVLTSRVVDRNGKTLLQTKTSKNIQPGEVATIHEDPEAIANPHRWSLEDPYLYKIISEIKVNDKVVDQVITPYGIRTIKWQIAKNSAHQFLLNGKPVFINGIAEYEHLIGGSHAFSDEQVRTRVKEVITAGFNAFRDAHQPHNLCYQRYWDGLGILWWAQFSAHDWFDTPQFRENFKQLLKDWIKERRNSPSVILWGLQNESKLPEDFSKECSEIIRRLDPTASSQRLITTCNGGSGTDWDVPQNWTGTYGGDPATYSNDLKKQILVGEYGGWRTVDLHTEGSLVQSGIVSEDRLSQLLEMKTKLAKAAKDSAAGHFMWLLTSHENPGRMQAGEGYRELDRIGPVNYKGLLTPWEEPTDAYYMYRANYVSKEKDPMVYISSHTWPDRWTQAGIKNGIVVYSNCDEVELFNDVHSQSLGRRKRDGIGTHFQWDNVNIKYNVLYIVGYVNGKAVAKDQIVLNHLPKSPNFNELVKDAKPITKPLPGYNYIYRVNCGGREYTDVNGNVWMADRALPAPPNESYLTDSRFQTPGSRLQALNFGSSSWTNDFPGMSSFFASQRKTNDPIKGTQDWPLFQTFRYGREKLKFTFPVPDGEYLIELFFTEPWIGTGGGKDFSGWRLFDVAVNDKIVLHDLDLWKESGHASALKKTVVAKISGGQIVISFPHVASGQAVISAIAIASKNKDVKPAKAAPILIQNLVVNDKEERKFWSINEWLNTGDLQYGNNKISFASLPPFLFGAEWIRTPELASSTSQQIASFKVEKDADVFIAVDSMIDHPSWLPEFELTKDIIRNDAGNVFQIFRRRYLKGSTVFLYNNRNSEKSIGYMYSIFVVPVTTMEPAYDLKPVTSYKAINATLSGAVQKGMVDGKERVIFSNASAQNALEWNISVGVADTYSLTISYNNPHKETLHGKLQIFATDGKLLKEDNIDLTPTYPGKSNYISTSTGTMINAGNYKVRLSANAEGVSVNSLDVQ